MRHPFRALLTFTATLPLVALFSVPAAIQAQVQTPPPGTSDAAKKPEIHITQKEAAELFKSVDEIQGFAAKDSGLKSSKPVKKVLITRDAVTRYLKQKFDEDEGAKRMERSEIVLKKFGLLDHDFDLKPFLLSLLTEQIAGYYDNKTKTINLLDWVEPETQKPVMAHELTHALQDQHVDLTRWGDQGLKDIAKNVQQDNAHIKNDEADTTREAVLEGQAMIVFVDYSMKDTGKTLADVPEELMGRMKDMLSGTDSSPVLSRAPLILQQSLLFPYANGLTFEQAILRRKGVQAAFTGTLDNPPVNTSQIMHPESYLAQTPQPLIHLADLHPLLEKEYTPYDVGVLGEFDVHMLAELFAGPQMADALAPSWAGGVYYAALKKNAPATTANLGLLYYSRWKNKDSAESFQKLYSAQLARKYSGLQRRSDEEKDGEEIYSTNEGDVLISKAGSGVFTSEGFPLELARKLRDQVTANQGEGPTQLVMQPLSTPLMNGMARLGVMKAGIHEAGRYTHHLATTGE
ncbi:hypothetical protein [Terriglobus tenax]|uniref:hypothetical protein n=1 Tax=Terriglobus tenax TaxID=1111115 RepID=UPI0021DF674F|nr:hypothetical protein [Terriglobus tenax]